MQEGEKKKDSSMVIALVLFMGAAGLVFLYLGEGSSGNAAKKFVKTPGYEKVVNRHLMMTNERIQHEQQKMQLESSRLLNKGAKVQSSQHAYQNDDTLDLSHDQRAQDVARVLGRGEKQESLETPDDVIQREVFENEQMQSYSEEYKREYARQFVENARRGGYQVILTDDLTRVKSVRAIRNNDSGMSLYGSGSSTAPLQ